MSVIRFQQTTPSSHDPAIQARRMVNRSMGAKSVSSGISIFSPGAEIFLHTHPCEEVIVILDGEAACELNGEKFTVGKHDMVMVPTRVPHRFWNESDLPFTMLYFYPSVEVTRDPVDPKDQQGEQSPHY